jgi:hypothetical protein
MEKLSLHIPVVVMRSQIQQIRIGQYLRQALGNSFSVLIINSNVNFHVGALLR